MYEKLNRPNCLFLETHKTTNHLGAIFRNDLLSQRFKKLTTSESTLNSLSKLQKHFTSTPNIDSFDQWPQLFQNFFIVRSFSQMVPSCHFNISYLSNRQPCSKRLLLLLEGSTNQSYTASTKNNFYLSFKYYINNYSWTWGLLCQDNQKPNKRN